MISIKFKIDGKCFIYLTERTITSINFDTVKTDDRLRQLTKNLALTLRIDNSNLDELHNVRDTTEELLPREVDSVRDLIVFALLPFKNDIAYSEAVIEMQEGSTGGTSKYEFKNLFVTSYEEHFAKDERDTIIKIELRELEV